MMVFYPQKSGFWITVNCRKMRLFLAFLKHCEKTTQYQSEFRMCIDFLFHQSSCLSFLTQFCFNHCGTLFLQKMQITSFLTNLLTSKKALFLTDLFEKDFFQCNRIRILFKGMEGLHFRVGTSLGTCRQAIVILKCIT